MMVLINTTYYRMKKKALYLVLCLLSLGLAGCVNDDVSDLRRYIKGVKARPKSSIQALPRIKIVEPFIFNPEGLRDPFRAVEISQDEALQEVNGGSGIRPDTARRKEELEGYPLDTLRMVGTLTMDKGLWALVKASDGTIHRVQKGNHMGQNYGEIIRILDGRIEMMEIVPDKPGAWREQQASLELAE